MADETRKVILKKDPKTAVAEARGLIMQERSGEQSGLLSGFRTLDIANGKYARFNNVNLWAGLSGHGKSYLLNILNKNMLSPIINPKIKFQPLVFNFCFEMSAHNEILRSVANDMGVSYGYLLSSHYNGETQEYNELTDAEMRRVDEYLKYYESQNMLFFETPGTVAEIYDTIVKYTREYNLRGQNTGVVYYYIVNIDHTLLINAKEGQKALELMAAVGKMSIAVRKGFKAMVNLVGQLNNNIEDVRRLTTPALQHPQKSDIYAQGQLYNACDNVYVIHQPALLKIQKYGLEQYPTENLVHLLKLKSRHGNVGNVWFNNDLNRGGLILIDPSEKKKDVSEENNEQYHDI